MSEIQVYEGDGVERDAISKAIKGWISNPETFAISIGGPVPIFPLSLGVKRLQRGQGIELEIQAESNETGSVLDVLRKNYLDNKGQIVITVDRKFEMGVQEKRFFGCWVTSQEYHGKNDEYTVFVVHADKEGSNV